MDASTASPFEIDTQLAADHVRLARVDTELKRAAGTRRASLLEVRRTIAVQIAQLEAAYEQRGQWSRFFTVPDGHHHRDRDCRTCRRGTAFTWTPHLSGMTEAEAVADQGPFLCSVCFPSAPVAWRRTRTKSVG